MPLPAEMAEEVRQDSAARKLCSRVVRWLPYAGYAPPELKERAMFRMRMRGRGICGGSVCASTFFVADGRRLGGGRRRSPSGLLDAILRPFRLLKKYRSSE